MTDFSDLEEMLSLDLPPSNGSANTLFSGLPLQQQTPLVINPNAPIANVQNPNMRMPNQNLMGMNGKPPQVNVPLNSMQNQGVGAMQNRPGGIAPQAMQKMPMVNNNQQALNRNAMQNLNPANMNVNGINRNVNQGVNGLPIKQSAGMPMQGNVGQQGMGVKQSVGAAPLRPAVGQIANPNVNPAVKAAGQMQPGVGGQAPVKQAVKASQYTPQQLDEVRKRNADIAVAHFESIAHQLPEQKQKRAIEELKKFRMGKTAWDLLFHVLKTEIYGEVEFKNQLSLGINKSKMANNGQLPGQPINNLQNASAAAVKASGVNSMSTAAIDAQKLLKTGGLPLQTGLPQGNISQNRPPTSATPINNPQMIPGKKVAGFAPKLATPPVKGSMNVPPLTNKPTVQPLQSATTVVPPYPNTGAKPGVDLTKEASVTDATKVDQTTLFNIPLLKRKVEETVRRNHPDIKSVAPEVYELIFQAAKIHIRTKIFELERAARVRMDEQKNQFPVVYTNDPKQILETIENDRQEMDKNIKDDKKESDLTESERQVNNMNNAASQALMTNRPTPNPIFKPVPIKSVLSDAPPPSLNQAEIDKLQQLHKKEKDTRTPAEQQIYQDLFTRYNAFAAYKAKNARRITLKDIVNCKRVIDPESPLMVKCEILRIRKKPKLNS